MHSTISGPAMNFFKHLIKHNPRTAKKYFFVNELTNYLYRTLTFAERSRYVSSYYTCIESQEGYVVELYANAKEPKELICTISLSRDGSKWYSQQNGKTFAPIGVGGYLDKECLRHFQLVKTAIKSAHGGVSETLIFKR